MLPDPVMNAAGHGGTATVELSANAYIQASAVQTRLGMFHFAMVGPPCTIVNVLEKGIL